jgi:hypothetical protein
MKKIYWGIIIMLVFLASCRDNVEVSNPIVIKTMESYTIQIKSAAISNQKVTFDVSCYVPNPCWIYDRFESNIAGNNVYVTVYAKERTDVGCAEIEVLIFPSIEILLPANGTYNFHFKGYQNSTKDTTLTVR